MREDIIISKGNIEWIIFQGCIDKQIRIACKMVKQTINVRTHK